MQVGFIHSEEIKTNLLCLSGYRIFDEIMIKYNTFTTYHNIIINCHRPHFNVLCIISTLSTFLLVKRIFWRMIYTTWSSIKLLILPLAEGDCDNVCTCVIPKLCIYRSANDIFLHYFRWVWVSASCCHGNKC